MKRAVRGAMVVVGTAAGLGLAAAYVPAFVWPDARVPDSLSISLQSARRQLWAEAADGLRLPLHFSFVDSRCASDGSLALIFEEHRPPYLERRFAYVARGSAPMNPRIASCAVPKSRYSRTGPGNVATSAFGICV